MPIVKVEPTALDLRTRRRIPLASADLFTAQICVREEVEGEHFPPDSSRLYEAVEVEGSLKYE